MIYGRPSNLWLGAATAIFNVAVLSMQAFGIVTPADVIAAVNIALGSVIALIAFQPPTLNVGDKVTVKTSNGDPDRTVTFGDTGQVSTNVSKG